MIEPVTSILSQDGSLEKLKKYCIDMPKIVILFLYIYFNEKI